MSIIDRLFIQIAVTIENLKNQEGQGMVEYGLILALIAVVCVVAFTALGAKIGTTIASVTSAL